MYLASSAEFCISLGLTKTLGTLNKATTLKISVEQLNCPEFNKTLLNQGSKGNSAIIEPTLVKSPSSSKAYKLSKINTNKL